MTTRKAQAKRAAAAPKEEGAAAPIELAKMLPVRRKRGDKPFPEAWGEPSRWLRGGLLDPLPPNLVGWQGKDLREALDFARQGSPSTLVWLLMQYLRAVRDGKSLKLLDADDALLLEVGQFLLDGLTAPAADPRVQPPYIADAIRRLDLQLWATAPYASDARRLEFIIAVLQAFDPERFGQDDPISLSTVRAILNAPSLAYTKSARKAREK